MKTTHTLLILAYTGEQLIYYIYMYSFSRRFYQKSTSNYLKCGAVIKNLIWKHFSSKSHFP